MEGTLTRMLDNTNIDLTEGGCGYVDLIQVAQDS
jgi:hypothetical protein